MGLQGKVCTRGIWDESIPGISFDKEGISNFCRLQEKMMKDYPRGEEGNKIWKELVTKIKLAGKNKKYDCIIGVSGGVDSSYLLHISKQYGLNPLAVNLDNGFSSDIAVQNIYKVTKKLKIDLETYVVDYDEVKDLLKAFMKASLPWIDSPTDLAIKATMYKIALEENIQYIIRGNDFRSEGKQPKEWTYSDSRQLRFIHKKFGTGVKLKTYPVLTLSRMVYAGFVKKIKDVRPFYFLEYNKQDAKKLLMAEYDWQDYGGHHHENLFTKFSMAYWLPNKFNIDKRKINLSAQILSNAISRESALIEIEKDFDTPENLIKLKEYTLKKLDFDSDSFEKLMNSANKSYTDYPSNYNLIYSNIKYFKWVISKMYSFKPMSIDSNEILSSNPK